jgi:hypothetical protein
MFSNSLKKIICAGVFALTAGSFSAMALTVEASSNVPFAFRIGDKALPAGEYRLAPASTMGRWYYLTNAKTGRSVLILRSSVENRQPKALVFGKSDEGYVLKSVR